MVLGDGYDDGYVMIKLVKASSPIAHLLVGSKVEGHVAEDGVGPHGGGELELVRGEVNPRVDEGLVDEGDSKELSVGTGTGDIPSNGVALEDHTTAGLENRGLPEGGEGGGGGIKILRQTSFEG